MQTQLCAQIENISTFYFENQNKYARIIIGFLNFSLFTSNKLFKIDCLLMRKSKKKQFSVPKKEY